MESMDAGEMAQLTKHMLGKHENLTLIPRTHVNDGECFVYSLLRRWKQEDPGPHWIASPAQLLSSRLIRDPFSKHKGNNS